MAMPKLPPSWRPKPRSAAPCPTSLGASALIEVWLMGMMSRPIEKPTNEQGPEGIPEPRTAAIGDPAIHMAVTEATMPAKISRRGSILFLGLVRMVAQPTILTGGRRACREADASPVLKRGHALKRLGEQGMRGRSRRTVRTRSRETG